MKFYKITGWIAVVILLILNITGLLYGDDNIIKPERVKIERDLDEISKELPFKNKSDKRTVINGESEEKKPLTSENESSFIRGILKKLGEINKFLKVLLPYILYVFAGAVLIVVILTVVAFIKREHNILNEKTTLDGMIKSDENIMDVSTLIERAIAEKNEGHLVESLTYLYRSSILYLMNDSDLLIRRSDTDSDIARKIKERVGQRTAFVNISKSFQKVYFGNELIKEQQIDELFCDYNEHLHKGSIVGYKI